MEFGIQTNGNDQAEADENPSLATLIISRTHLAPTSDNTFENITMCVGSAASRASSYRTQAGLCDDRITYDRNVTATVSSFLPLRK